MLHFARIVVLLRLFPHAKADECSPEHIDWTPAEWTNKAINDCDILSILIDLQKNQTASQKLKLKLKGAILMPNMAS